MTPRRRLTSWWWDYLVVLTWLGIVFLVMGMPTLLGVIDLESLWSGPALADLATAALTVIPFLMYLVVTETRPSHATWGKRRSGLSVAAADGSSPALGQVVLRNIVKVLPWQLGHMAALRFATDTQIPTATACYALSLLLLVAVAGPPLVRRRGLHDMIAGTTVMTRASAERPR